MARGKGRRVVGRCAICNRLAAMPGRGPGDTLADLCGKCGWDVRRGLREIVRSEALKRLEATAGLGVACGL